MEGILSILLFFICTWGFGFTITSFAKKQENFLERHLMNIGLGLGFWVILGLFLNLVGIKLHWAVFLAAGAIYPLYYYIKNFRRLAESAKAFRPKLTKYSLCILLVVVISIVNLYVYEKGAFSYPYLEDDDSWGHAIGAKYVAVEKSAFSEKPLRYIDPYPPGYD